MKSKFEALLAAKQKEREQRAQAQDEDERIRLERRIERRAEAELRKQKELREHASIIESCLSEYNPRRLHDWFKLDNWSVSDGLVILSGYDPKNVPLDEEGRPNFPSMRTLNLRAVHGLERMVLDRVYRLDGFAPLARLTLELLDETLVDSIMFDFEFGYAKMRKIWDSGAHADGRYPPKYFIDWAISKEIEIEWLEWARSHGYYGADASSTSMTDSDDKHGNIAPKSEAAYLNIIGALTQLYWTAAHPGRDYSQSALLAELSKYEGYAGLSERNLKDKLTKAVRAISGKG